MFLKYNIAVYTTSVESFHEPLFVSGTQNHADNTGERDQADEGKPQPDDGKHRAQDG